MVFISLLLPKGRGKEVVDYLKKLKAPQGIKIHDAYLTLGHYDGVIVFEAPDAKTALNFTMDTGCSTDYAIETLSAIPAEEL